MFKKVTQKQELRIKISSATRAALDALITEAKDGGYEVDTDAILEEGVKHAVDKAQKELRKLTSESRRRPARQNGEGAPGAQVDAGDQNEAAE